MPARLKAGVKVRAKIIQTLDAHVPADGLKPPSADQPREIRRIKKKARRSPARQPKAEPAPVDTPRSVGKPSHIRL